MMVYALLFVLGLAAGSFLNVVSLRYRPGERLLSSQSVGGRSRCPQCGASLTWRELIPVLSFVFQRGRCRSCGGRISFQYPLVEILSGLIVLAVPVYFAEFYKFNLLLGGAGRDYYFFSAVWISALLVLLLASVIDFYHYLIPNSLNVLIALFGAAVVGWRYFFGGGGDLLLDGSFFGHYAAVFGLRESAVISHLAAAGLAALFLGFIILVSRGRAMGMGDLKLGAALGLLLGYPDIILALALSFFVGAAVSLALMAAREKGMKDFVPFGPFLAVGTALTLFFGYPLVNWYFKLFSL